MRKPRNPDDPELSIAYFNVASHIENSEKHVDLRLAYPEIPKLTMLGIHIKLFIIAACDFPDGTLKFKKSLWFAERLGWQDDWGKIEDFLKTLDAVGIFDTGTKHIHNWEKWQTCLKNRIKGREYLAAKRVAAKEEQTYDNLSKVDDKETRPQPLRFSHLAQEGEYLICKSGKELIFKFPVVELHKFVVSNFTPLETVCVILDKVADKMLQGKLDPPKHPDNAWGNIKPLLLTGFKFMELDYKAPPPKLAPNPKRVTVLREIEAYLTQQERDAEAQRAQEEGECWELYESLSEEEREKIDSKAEAKLLKNKAKPESQLWKGLLEGTKLGILQNNLRKIKWDAANPLPTVP